MVDGRGGRGRVVVELRIVLIMAQRNSVMMICRR